MATKSVTEKELYAVEIAGIQYRVLCRTAKGGDATFILRANGKSLGVFEDGGSLFTALLEVTARVPKIETPALLAVVRTVFNI